MPNYGDVALNLGPDWDRSKLFDSDQALMTVGHTNGVADARLEKTPDVRHQFAWCDPLYTKELDRNRVRGYEYVNKNAGWVKNEKLWAWDAEGHCVCLGQRLMARPAELFERDMEERKRLLGRAEKKMQDEDEAAAEATKGRRGMRARAAV